MASFSPRLGIDLGTTNVLVFVPGKGVVLNEPSVVAVSTETNKVLAIGVEAKAMVGRTPDSIQAYRPISYEKHLDAGTCLSQRCSSPYPQV